MYLRRVYSVVIVSVDFSIQLGDLLRAQIANLFQLIKVRIFTFLNSLSPARRYRHTWRLAEEHFCSYRILHFYILTRKPFKYRKLFSAANEEVFDC